MSEPRAVARSDAPAWAAYPLLAGGGALVIAVFGLFWDVAYHVDHGRDVNLFTPAHLMILVGLLGLGVAALGSIALATRARLADAWALGPIRIPRAALPLALMAGGAGIGFPLDDLWHATYGIDVTLWSPTHLLMIGGAVCSTFALCLYLPEGGLEAARSRLIRWRRVTIHGATLIALSVFLLEFDFGIPQWRAVYHPLLIAIAAGIALVAARVSLGRWGAIRAAVFYVVLRILLSIFVRLVGHTPPSAPLMLPEAMLVEAAFLLENRIGRVRAALLAGLLIGVPGLAVEWLWTSLTYALPWHASLLPWMWLPFAAAVVASVVGLAFGSAVARRPSGLPQGAGLLAVLVLAGLLALPLPRASAPGQAEITASPVGAPRQVHDRFGGMTTEQDYQVSVAVSPADYARSPDWFVILAWQGGGRRVVHLEQVAPGRYRATGAVPTGGSWKSMVFLGRGEVLSAVPVSFPPDPESHQAGVPIGPQQTHAFVPASQLLMSEAHGGAPWVAWAAYAALIAVAAVWVLSVALAARMVGLPPRRATSRRAAA